MSDPTPYLRRDPDPTEGNGRKVLVGVFAFFLLLAAFVLILYFAIGRHSEVKIPPGPAPRASQPS